MVYKRTTRVWNPFTFAICKKEIPMWKPPWLKSFLKPQTDNINKALTIKG